jgi:hypothetical protein
MTKTQKLILAIGLLVFVASAIFPPWRDYNGLLGQFAFFTHPGSDIQIDIHRLLLEWIVIVTVTSVLLLLATKGKSQ